MKSLETIQRTFRVFQILTKIAMILSFVWAGLALLGMLCGAVWYGGGTVVGIGKAQLYSLTKTGGLIQMIAVLLAEIIGETLERAARANGVAPNPARVHMPLKERDK